MASQPSQPAPTPLTLPRAHRLRGRRLFDLIFQEGTPGRAGPLNVRVRENELNHLRLGLGVGRRAGKAVRRQRIRRLLREAYRLQRQQLPCGYDVVITVRFHEPVGLQQYMQWLERAITAAVTARLRQSHRPACPGAT